MQRSQESGKAGAENDSSNVCWWLWSHSTGKTPLLDRAARYTPSTGVKQNQAPCVGRERLHSTRSTQDPALFLPVSPRFAGWAHVWNNKLVGWWVGKVGCGPRADAVLSSLFSERLFHDLAAAHTIPSIGGSDRGIMERILET